jgi:hypothetical protein
LRFFPVLFLLLCLLSSPLYAQEDSSVLRTADTAAMTAGTVTRKDSIQKKLPFQPNPKKAGLYSALLPGAGQLYNRQYWKIPVVYAAFGVGGYFIVSNYQQYNRYRTAYIAVIDKDPNTVSTELYAEADLKQLQDQYKEWLDLTVLFTSVGYMLQIMDAVVFAHLKNFDVSPDISMKLQPVSMPNGGAGVGLVFNLR